MDDLSEPLDVAEIAAEAPDDGGRDGKGRFVSGNPHRWQPGQPGNPAGFTAGRRSAKALVEAGKTLVWIKDHRGNLVERTLQSIADEAMWRAAAKGNVNAYREIHDRTEGKVPLPFRMTNEGPAGETEFDVRIEVADAAPLDEFDVDRKSLPPAPDAAPSEPPEPDPQS